MSGLPTTIEAELDKMLNEYLDKCDEMNDRWDLSLTDNDRFEPDYYEYSQNMPCDTYGMCAGTSCSKYFECQGGR